MRALLFAVILLAIPALLPSVSAAGDSPFAAASPACVPVAEARDELRDRDLWACSVEHSGTVGAPACTGTTCVIPVSTRASADGLGWNDKKLEHRLEVALAGKQSAYALCTVMSVEAHLGCGRELTLSLAMPVGTCATLTFNTRFMEKILALPTIGTAATSAVTVCNA